MENYSAEAGSQTPNESSSSFTVQGDSYAKFGRCLKGWHTFKDVATSAEPHWFKDLLSLWCPSGHPSGDYGLRLAIRNGYLNFYRLGQSVARVECVKAKLVAYVHYKYVGVEPQPGMSKSPYLRLNQKGVSFRDKLVASNKGTSTLLEWISVAGGETHAGDEKSIVDELVAKNDNVIDLEMALPAWTSPKVAIRMDLVAIEDGEVVFWEVKTVNDSRIRCKAEFEMDNFPEVLKQLSSYRVYLEQASHVEQVKKAYLKTASSLVELRKLADKIGPPLRLGSSIVAASHANTLAVAPRAALVVVGLHSNHKQAKSAWKSWKADHEGKLSGKIPMRVLESAGRLKYEGAL
jgi:hypothetical protein